MSVFKFSLPIYLTNLFISTFFLQVFDKLKEKYTAIELDQRDDGEEIQNVLGEITGARSVRRI